MESSPTQTQESATHLSPLTHTIFATVVSIKGELAVLRTENGQEIIWSISKLPPDATIGSELNLIATTSPILTEEKLDSEKAKKVLEMLLNS